MIPFAGKILFRGEGVSRVTPAAGTEGALGTDVREVTSGTEMEPGDRRAWGCGGCRPGQETWSSASSI